MSSTPDVLNFDVVVIGAGPGGYVAAIRCAQLGLNTACIDAWENPQGKASLGGTCLNVGCIPSKALLESSEQYYRLTHSLSAHGITVENPAIDIAKMLARKDKIVKMLTGGIQQLFKANKVTLVHGHARLLADRTVEVHDNDQQLTQALRADHVIIAAGSTPVAIPVAKTDQQYIVDSTGALAFSEVPKHLLVIGAGVIGLELGSVWRRLGARVTVLEALDEFLPMADQAVARETQKQLKRQGLDIHLGTRVTGSEVADEQVTVHYDDQSGSQTLTADRVIVAVGRKPCGAGAVDPSSGVTLDARGFIEIDSHWQTSTPGVYAIGDAVTGPMLAHKASEEGVAVAETVAGKPGHVNYTTIPAVIYTHPEVAWVGESEQSLATQEIPFQTGQFAFAANGRARAMEETTGFVKIIAHQQTDRILGVHMVGPNVSELISEAVLAMEYSASSEDLARTIHAHPTLAEVVHEAALAVDKRAIHKAN